MERTHQSSILDNLGLYPYPSSIHPQKALSTTISYEPSLIRIWEIDRTGAARVNERILAMVVSGRGKPAMSATAKGLLTAKYCFPSLSFRY